MADPVELRHDVLAAVAGAVDRYLTALDDAPVLDAAAADTFTASAGTLPEDGDGALAAVRELVEKGIPAATRSSGPHFFHFVTGGTTPAALAADWLASARDQNAFSWVASPLGSRLEVVAVDWLRELFGLPTGWGGVLTTGATTANFTALAAARCWWGGRQGRDVDADGLAGLPAVPVFSSGYVHPSALKALAMLGIGRGSVRVRARDAIGRLDADALERGPRPSAARRRS